MNESQQQSSQPRTGVALSALIDSGIFAGVLLAAVFAFTFMSGKLNFEELSYKTAAGTILSALMVVTVTWPLALLVWYLEKKGVFSSPIMLIFCSAFLNAPAFILAYFSMDGLGKGLAIRLISAVISVIIISKLNDRESP